MAAPSTNRKRLVYWVTLRKGSLDIDLCKILSQDGFDVKIALSLAELESWAMESRPAIIVVTDQGPSDEVHRLLDGLMSLADLRGAKMVMVSFTGDQRIKQQAAGSSFRDIIPSDLSAEEFRNRFRFVTANRPPDLLSSNNGSYPEKHFALRGEMPVKIYLPCRLTQIGSRTLKIESRLRPALGSRVQLTGPLTQALGLPFISLRVTEHLATGLIHRFSSGFIADWQLSPSLKLPDNGLQSFWSDIAQRSTQTEFRVFVAMSQATARQAVLKLFKDPSFIVATALQRHSITSEPQYFAPDFVIFDDVLSLEKNGQTLLQVLPQFAESCHVFIVSHSDKNRTHIAKILEEKSFTPYINRIKNIGHEYLRDQHLLKDLIFKIADEKSLQFSPESSVPDPSKDLQRIISSPDRFHLKSQDPWTYGQIILPALVTSLHHRFVEILSPVSIGSFSLLRLNSVEISQALKRAPFAKIVDEQMITKADTENPSQPKMSYLYKAYLSDLRVEEIRRLAQWTFQLFQNNLEIEQLTEKQKIQSNEEKIATNEKELSRGIDPLPAGQSQETEGENAQVPIILKEEAPLTTQRTPIVEISKELGREALEGLKNTLEGHQTKGFFSSIVPVVVIGGIMVGILWGLFAYLSQDFKKSGGVYTEQIKNFSP